MNFRLHIKELVLHGFDHFDRYEIGVAVEQELARLIVENGLLSSINESACLSQLNAESFEVSDKSNPAMIGMQVGQSIYESIGQSLAMPANYL